jgi:glycosyltransferase involved in cell wall biosynthesis
VHVALITDAPLCRDIRTQRTVEALDELGMTVSVFDQGFYKEQSRDMLGSRHDLISSTIPQVGLKKLFWHLGNRLSPMSAYSKRTKELRENLDSVKPDVIHCVNVFGLEAAERVATTSGVPLVYEPLEYWPSYLFSSTYRIRSSLGRYLANLEKKVAGQVSLLITVSPVMASNYESLGFRESEVVFNANVPSGTRKNPSPVHAPIRIVHSGHVNRDRNVDAMIDACIKNPLVILTIQGDGPCLEELKLQAKGAKNILFKRFVPNEEVVASLSEYDIGLAGLSTGDGLADYALPNKIFDYMAAGLSIICTTSKSVASLKDSADFVTFVPNPIKDCFESAINDLARDPSLLEQKKHNALDASREYSRAAQKQHIKRIYQERIASKG